jgi:ADP-ribosylation factor GTPase-activating protein 2/3
MKTGGNESATKYFQSHGGAAALASKDPKTKYTSNAANKYKDELARRVEADQRKYVEWNSLWTSGLLTDNLKGTRTVW